MGLPYPKVTLESLDRLLNERFSNGFFTLQDLPHPSAFKDMDRATERIVQAIKKNEKITIIGDYDVDGVVSTTLMKQFFDEIGYEVEWIIPNRFRDGYGLSEKIIPRILGTDLAITVDNGISAFNAAKLCKEHGIELIITDHHIPGKNLPEAYAIVNQKQNDCSFPYHEVCGAQIAWYLIASIKNTLGVKIDMMAYMGLVSIAVIADIMPLVHINRVMVLAGLKVLEKGQLPSIKAFMEQTQKNTLEAEDIGFFFAPLINSAGRMDDAKHAVEFLLSKNIYDARVRLQRLQIFNETRKEAEEKITNEALQSVNSSDEVLVLSGEEWHEGVIGIVAARIARRHNKPAIILSGNEGILKGSGRSIEGCDLFEIVDGCREYLEKFGGHSAAIGLSLKASNLLLFKSALQQAYSETDTVQNTIDPEIVGELDFSLVSFDLTNLIKQYEPFGHANTKPKFITTNVRLAEVNKMGKEGNHLRLLCEHQGNYFTGVKFKTTETFEVDSRVTITYRVNENHFNGKVSLQLLIEDIVL